MSAEDKPTHVMVMETISQKAREVALRDGYHVPSVFARGTERSAIGQLADLPGTHEARVKHLFEAGVQLRQEGQLGLLLQVIFITEAWLSLPEDGELNVRPSEDPNRIEALIIAGLSILEELSSMTIFEMVRDEEGELVDVREFRQQDSTEGEMQSPLLDAFVAGYVMGKPDDHPPLHQ